MKMVMEKMERMKVKMISHQTHLSSHPSTILLLTTGAKYFVFGEVL